MRTRAFAVVMGILLLSGATVFAADGCDLFLLGGVFTSDSVRSNQDTQQAAKDLICLTESKENIESSGWGLDVGVPVQGIPLKVGAGNQDRTSQAWKVSNCKDTQRDMKYADVFSRVKTMADVNLLEAYNRCKQGDRLGLQCRARTIDATTVKFEVQWVPTRLTDAAPHVDDFVGVHANCLTNLKGKTLTTARTEILCQRSTPEDVVIFNLQTDAGSCTDSCPPIQPVKQASVNTGPAIKQGVIGRLVYPAPRHARRGETITVEGTAKILKAREGEDVAAEFTVSFRGPEIQSPEFKSYETYAGVGDHPVRFSYQLPTSLPLGDMFFEVTARMKQGSDNWRLMNKMLYKVTIDP